MFVKICSCRTADAVRTAVDAGASAVGFIFVPRVRRYVPPRLARGLAALVPEGVWKVGVFLDQPLDEILAAVEVAGVDTVQLHGSEPPEVVAALRPRVRVIKAWGGVGPMPLGADHVLVEPRAGRPGGEGEAWDWSRVRGLPVILAGGLNPENVAAALDAVRPFGVDVSSGVEDPDGRKSPERIRAFCDAVRRWELERSLA
jgi:phosphoribosylanthranilate isomerase